MMVVGRFKRFHETLFACDAHPRQRPANKDRIKGLNLLIRSIRSGPQLPKGRVKPAPVNFLHAGHWGEQFPALNGSREGREAGEG